MSQPDGRAGCNPRRYPTPDTMSTQLLRPMVQATLGSLIFLSVSAKAPQAPNPTVQAVVAGMSCKQQERVQQLDCEYRVGMSLRFAIAGVGQPDAAVTFFKVDWDADYYASVGLAAGHRCVIVKPGAKAFDRLQMAFVAPENGKVYGDWQSCARAN